MAFTFPRPLRPGLPVLGILCACLAAIAPALGSERAPNERGLPFVQSFLPSDYEGHNQTWNAVQDRAGRLYVGNRDAVLTFDGQRWGRIETGGLFIYSLALDADDRLWIGGVNELGYLDDDGKGGRAFHSLREKLPPEAREFGAVFYLAVLPHGVYFVTSSGWLRWHDGRFAWSPGSRLTGWAVGGEFVFHERGEALRAFDGERWRIVTDAPVVHSNWVTLVAAQPDGAWLLGTLTDGFWQLRDGALSRWPTEVDERLRRHRISAGLVLADGSIWISQRPGGVLALDRDGRQLHYLDGANGLQGSLSSRFFADRSGGLWISLDRGLARLDWPASITHFTHVNGLGYGVVKAIARHAGRLYVGTSEGLFRLAPAQPPANARFEPVAGIGANVWSLDVTDGELVVATNNDVYTVAADGAIERLVTGGSYQFARRLPGPERVYALADSNALVVARRKADGATALQRIAGIEAEVRNAVLARDGSLWLTTLGQGLVRVREATSDRPQVEAIPGARGLLSAKLDGIPALARVGEDILVLDQGRVFRFDEGAARFVDAGDVAARLALTDTQAVSFAGGVDGHWWVRLQGKDDAAGPWRGRQFWGIDPSGGTTRLPFQVAEAIGENPTFLEENGPAGRILWLGGSSGLVRVELPDGAVQPRAFQARIATLRDREGSPLALASTPLTRDFARRDLEVDLATDRLDRRHVRFVRQLDDAPPVTSATGTVDLRSLPPGRHRLTAFARDADGHESRPAVLDLTVRPPWWLAWWALGLYGAGGAAAIVGVVRWRNRALRRRNEELERLVTARTAELRAHESELVAARDAAESANRAKSVFLASMSHELRTPLNAILGYAQILRQSPRLEAEQRRQLDTVHASGDHLLHLINDVLDLAKIEAGKVELAPQPVSLSRLLAHLTEVFEPRAAQKSLAWSLHGETPLPDLVLADEARLRQVLYNLLGNALKFTERGRIELRVAAHEHRVRFTVVDTGIGIAAADQAAIFNLFHQAAGPALSAHGAGLGLAISQRLVRLMGGEITVESSPGAGSRFSFAVELPPALGTPPAASEKIPTGYRGPRRRVLVVDDEAVNREVLHALLAPLGFLVDEAETAEAALAQVAARAPDLVLMDLRLRGLDGLAATRRLRALPHGDALRIIAISASVFPLDRAQALEAGCDEFEPKPFRAASLLVAIGRLLNLEWTTADSAAPFAPPETLPPDWRVPAPSALAQLEELAEFGDLVALRAALTAARATQPNAAPFLDALAHFAAHAELASLRTWIAAARARPVSDSP